MLRDKLFDERLVDFPSDDDLDDMILKTLDIALDNNDIYYTPRWSNYAHQNRIIEDPRPILSDVKKRLGYPQFIKNDQEYYGKNTIVWSVGTALSLFVTLAPLGSNTYYISTTLLSIATAVFAYNSVRYMASLFNRREAVKRLSSIPDDRLTDSMERVRYTARERIEGYGKSS